MASVKTPDLLEMGVPLQPLVEVQQLDRVLASIEAGTPREDRKTTSHSARNSVERASRHFPNPSPTELSRAFWTHAPAAKPQVNHVAATYNMLHALNFGKQVEHHRPHLENPRKPQVRAPLQ
jgi:hypothetical protein